MSTDLPPWTPPPPMSKPRVRSTIYRLIEAGQLAHRTLLGPLAERGLDAGDDAILFLLHTKLGATEAGLSTDLGLPAEVLKPRLDRLLDRDLIAPHAVGPELAPGLALTDRGQRIRDALAGSWDVLEEALFGDLSDKQRKAVDKALKRFTELLRLP